MVCRNISCGGSLIFSRAKPTLRQPLADPRKSSEKKQFPHPCLLRRHSRAGGNPDLRLSEIFSDYRSMGFAHGYGLQKCQLRRISIYSRGQSPRYGCRLQIPASHLKKTVSTSLPATPSFPRRRESRPLAFGNIQ